MKRSTLILFLIPLIGLFAYSFVADPNAVVHASAYGGGSSATVPAKSVLIGVARPSARVAHAFEDRQSYVLQGNVGVNVRAALNANNGALRHVIVQPGTTWSFGASIAPIDALGDLPVVCGPAGCYAGGGWCDLAAMYMRTAFAAGLSPSFPQHSGISQPFPGILLNNDGSGGDLRITNTLSYPIQFRAEEQDDTLVVTLDVLQ